MTGNLKTVLTVAGLMTFICPDPAAGDVVKSSPNGFVVTAEQTVRLSAADAYTAFVRDFNKWYDAAHSYSGRSENLSLDMEKHCMLEKLPDGGFVRHMEIVYHQPGKVLRLSGGLGPLQEMGVAGALTFAFAESEGHTTVLMTYAVTGADHSGLDAIAAPVSEVLTGQLVRFSEYCRKIGN